MPSSQVVFVVFLLPWEELCAQILGDSDVGIIVGSLFSA